MVDVKVAHLMRSDGRVSRSKVHVVRTVVRPTALFAASLDRASLRRDLVIEELCSPLTLLAGSGSVFTPLLSASGSQCRRSTCDAVPPRVCASATFARFIPRFLAMRNAQAFNVENRVIRVRMTFAASNKAVRTITPPTLVIRPVRSTSPDWYKLGVIPKYGPRSLDLRNRVGSSTAVR